MKDTFAHPSKTLVEEALLRALSAKKSFVLFNVGTTGFDTDDIATRIYAHLYSYNKATKQYEKIQTFDRLLAPPPEFLSEISDESSVKRDQIQRIFRSAGISFSDYLEGKNTLSAEEMVTELGYFMKAAERCDFGLINGTGFAETYLTKIGAFEPFLRMRRAFHLFDQADLTKAMYPNAPSNSLDSIAVYAYRLYDVRTAAAKLSLLADIVRDYGAHGAVLSPNADQASDKVQRTAELSEKGKEKYQNADLNGKFDILLGNTSKGFAALQPKTPYFQGHGYPEIYTPETDRLLSAFANKKGFTSIAVSTTGLTSSGKYAVHNQPIRLTVMPCVLDQDGKTIVVQKTKGFECDIFASETEILAAKAMADDGGYDVFHHGNIDYNEYRKNSMEGRLASAKQVAERLQKYFAEYPIADFPILSCATQEYQGRYISFAQEALLRMEGKDAADQAAAAAVFQNIPGFISRGIDFSQFLKEAAYQKFTGTETFANSLCNLSRWTEPSFSLECFVRHHKGDPSFELNGSFAKASSVASLTKLYYHAYLENEKPGPVIVNPALSLEEAKKEQGATAPAKEMVREDVSIQQSEPQPAMSGARRLNLRKAVAVTKNASEPAPKNIPVPAATPPTPKVKEDVSSVKEIPPAREAVVSSEKAPSLENEALSSLILLCRTQASVLEKQTVLLEQQGKLLTSLTEMVSEMRKEPVPPVKKSRADSWPEETKEPDLSNR